MTGTDHPTLRSGLRNIQENGLLGRVAVVTGASSGIGRAIALALSRLGVQLCIVGRNDVNLAETAAQIRQFSRVNDFRIDLTADDHLEPLLQHLKQEAGRVDVLIHCAGVVHLDLMEHARVEDFDLQYATNIRAPYRLTQCLLPLLSAAHGQIVFVNSSLGLTAARPDVGQYAATKHALKAVADSLRAEVNPKGVRVLTIFLGRTATPTQEALYRQQGKPYAPELLLQPEDVAAVVIQALLLPATAEVTEISMRPMQKSY